MTREQKLQAAHELIETAQGKCPKLRLTGGWRPLPVWGTLLDGQRTLFVQETACDEFTPVGLALAAQCEMRYHGWI